MVYEMLTANKNIYNLKNFILKNKFATYTDKDKIIIRNLNGLRREKYNGR